MWPSSPAAPVGTAVELAAEDEAAADAGADREHERVVGAPGGTGPVLGQRGQVGVVVDHDRQAECARPARRAGSGFDPAGGQADADRLDLAAGRLARLCMAWAMTFISEA